ncbi:MAG: SiaB family protein kinase [Bacteroidales bacterium]|nr:SiaB family protein kinase [Bacteroidales bacterium]
MALVENGRDIFESMFDNKVVISYIGPFDGQILSLLASNIEDSLWGDPKRGKKFFKIFIELSQNIYLYSKEKAHGLDKSAGVGLMLIKEFDEHFQFITGNLVGKKDYLKLTEKCDLIMSKTKEELREFKRQQRSMPRESETDGGNIGIIQSTLLSGYPPSYTFHKIDDDNYFYILSIRIDK